MLDKKINKNKIKTLLKIKPYFVFKFSLTTASTKLKILETTKVLIFKTWDNLIFLKKTILIKKRPSRYKKKINLELCTQRKHANSNCSKGSAIKTNT